MTIAILYIKENIVLKRTIKKLLHLLAVDGFFLSKEKSVSIFTGNRYTSLDEAAKSLYEKRN